MFMSAQKNAPFHVMKQTNNFFSMFLAEKAAQKVVMYFCQSVSQLVGLSRAQ